MKLAFVLLESAQLPKASAVEKAHRKLAPDDPPIRCEEHKEMLRVFGEEEVMIALMPAPVPDGEADEAARFSLSAFSKWSLAPHHAHLVVAQPGEPNQSTPTAASLLSLARYTRVLAAVTRASQAVGVYWGAAQATHDPDFFCELASTSDSPVMLWSGLSIARDADKLSLLSLGMNQFGLPDLLVEAHPSSGNDAVEILYDLLAYLLDRGEPIPDGDTVGRSEDERWKVEYLPSPIAPSKQVWCIRLAKG